MYIPCIRGKQNQQQKHAVILNGIWCSLKFVKDKFSDNMVHNLVVNYKQEKRTKVS